jgi:hypothetical protein
LCTALLEVAWHSNFLARGRSGWLDISQPEFIDVPDDAIQVINQHGFGDVAIGMEDMCHGLVGPVPPRGDSRDQGKSPSIGQNSRPSGAA